MSDKTRILLVLLPFWTPLTPPMGITCLKSFLQKYGYTVTAVDASAQEELKDYSEQYFSTLKEFIPPEKRGNYYSIVHQVLRSHMMAQMNHTDEKEYLRLVRILVNRTFYYDLNDQQTRALVQILEDFYLELERYLIRLLEREQPGLLGLSVFSDTLAASIFTFKLTREKYPHIKTIMGGGVFADHLAPGTPDFTSFLEKTADYIDNIIIGEGENLFLGLLDGSLPEKQRVFTLDDIHNKTLDLAAVDVIDLSDFELDKYPYLVSYTSRSCPFQCTFCSETVQWGNYRRKKPSQVFKEMVYLNRRYGNRLFLLSDSLLNPVITGLAREFIQSDVTLYWEGWLRAEKEAADMENTLLWRRGGFYHARIGIESGSPRILEMMGKKITPTQVKEALTSLANAGIKTSTLWIVGYPGETEADFQQTLELIEALKYDIYEAEGTPFWYFLGGQSNSAEWQKKYKHLPLYPGEADDMLMVRSWILDCEPTREETFTRLGRFVRHLDKLGIPNTYSLMDIYKADKRWKSLQKNAVPSLVELEDKNRTINECKHIKKWVTIRSEDVSDIEFGF